MRKLLVISIALLALPLLASCACALAEKPVTGPRQVFAVVNDLPDTDDHAADSGEAEPEAEPEAEDAAWDEGWYEPEYYEEPVYDYVEPVYDYFGAVYDYQPGYSGGGDFKSQGVVYDDGTRYTWYSQNVLPGGGLNELNSNGRTVNDEGFVTDGDGYIAVASSDHAKGTVLDTPFGQAKVYDTGCPSGTVDVYTDF